MRYYINESIRVNNELFDKGFVLDTETRTIEWTEPIQNGETKYFNISNCKYDDTNNTPVSLDDGELIGIPEKEYFEQFKKGSIKMSLKENEKMLKRLNKIVEGIEKDHNEGHCEHNGDCDTFIVLVKFLKTEDGKTSLNVLESWVEDENDEQIYEAIVGMGFEAIKWIDNDKIDKWIEFAKKEGLEVVE